MNEQKLTAVEKRILTVLLDAFERRSGGTNRRIIVKADKFEEYDLSQIDRKKVFIESVKDLSDRGFVQYEWKKFERDNLLDRIILVEEAVLKIYFMLGRKTKEERRDLFLEELEAYQSGIKSEWIKKFLDEEALNIRMKSAWSGIWPKNLEQRAEFVSLLTAADEGHDASMRYLSVRLYGDSKKLEKFYKNKLVSVARKFIHLDLEDEQMLEYLGIQLNPSEILIYGPMEYTLHGKKISTADYRYGTSVNRSTVEHMTGISVRVDKVLTIENKAAYYEFIKNRPEGVFVIYLGGFFGRSVNEFLTKLKASSSLRFYHWSDIDLGGFRIFRYLTSILGKSVQPIGMDAVTYDKYSKKHANTERITEKQLCEISRMMEQPEMDCLHETMQKVIAKGRRLEQECIEISDFDTMFREMNEWF